MDVKLRLCADYWLLPGKQDWAPEPLLCHPWKGDSNIDFGVGAILQKAKGYVVSSTGLGPEDPTSLLAGKAEAQR